MQGSAENASGLSASPVAVSEALPVGETEAPPFEMGSSQPQSVGALQPHNMGASLPHNIGAFFAEYERAIARLQSTHEALHHQVAELKAELEIKNRLLSRQQRLAALGEMAAGVAHEIRNPLGAISLYVEMLHKDLDQQPEQREICTKVGAAVARLNHIVVAILDFTRPMEVRAVSSEVSALFSEVLEMASPGMLARRILVDVAIQPGAEKVWGDAILLHQLLLNLMRNAIEASPDGGRVSVDVGKSRDAGGRELRQITISDQGIGFEGEQIKHLFSPFYTTKQGGTGLGLALCQRIAEAHGGHIAAANGPCGGAQIRVELPHGA